MAATVSRRQCLLACAFSVLAGFFLAQELSPDCLGASGGIAEVAPAAHVGRLATPVAPVAAVAPVAPVAQRSRAPPPAPSAQILPTSAASRSPGQTPRASNPAAPPWPSDTLGILCVGNREVDMVQALVLFSSIRATGSRLVLVYIHVGDFQLQAYHRRAFQQTDSKLVYKESTAASVPGGVHKTLRSTAYQESDWNKFLAFKVAQELGLARAMYLDCDFLAHRNPEAIFAEVPPGRFGYCRGKASLLNSGLFVFDVGSHWEGLTQMLHYSWFDLDSSKKMSRSRGWNSSGIPDPAMATHWDKTQGGLYTYFVQLRQLGHELSEDLVYPDPHAQQPLGQHVFTHFAGKSKPCQVNFKGELSDSELAVYLPSQVLWRKHFFNLGLAPTSLRKCAPILIDLGANCGNTLPYLYKTRPETQKYDHYFLWELNPRLVRAYLTDLASRDKRVSVIPHPAWVRDENMTMYMDPREDERMSDAEFREAHPCNARSVKGRNPLGTSSVMQHDENYVHKAKVSYTTEAWNFTRWITEMGLHSRHNDILLKIDIEGAEYVLIPELFKSRAMCRITWLTVEWHEERHGFTPDSKQIAMRRNIKDDLLKFCPDQKIRYFDWV